MPEADYDEAELPDDAVRFDEMELVSSDAEFEDVSGFSLDDARHAWSVAEKRFEARQTDSRDAIVVFEDWAYEEWSDIDIAESPVMLVGRALDYSSDAYKFRGAFEVRFDKKGEVADEYINNLITQVNDATEEHGLEKGVRFAPKSAVKALVAPQF